jgi:subtilisin family serine protease
MIRIARVAGILAAVAMVQVLAASAAAASSPDFDPLPMKLPPSGAKTAHASLPGTWILGIRPSAQAQQIASDHRANRISDGAVVLPTGRAREAAAALKAAGMLLYAEPDVRRQRASSWDGFPDQWARGAVVPPDMVAPPLGRATIGVIDDQVDLTHGDLAGHTAFIGGMTITGPHGTMVASAASATAGNGGVMGVFPGVSIMSYGTSTLSCSDIVRGINALVDRHVHVINISLGSPSPCVAEFVAIEQAIGDGVVVVAAAGNEFQIGNPVEFPAAYPHVLSVASVRYPDYASSGFSNANAAIDLAAPGEGVPLAIPQAYDVQDGAQDGVTVASGTSFAAPIVAGVAAWLRSVRPSLGGPQIADVLRNGAMDIGPVGWDQDTGWGLVSVPGAIQQPDPSVDPLEPNDDIPFVNGTYFQGVDPVVYRGSNRRLVASVDFAEDPNDVYRIRIPSHSALRATLRPRYGDPDLFAYHDGARSLASRRAIVDRSVRTHGADRVYLINRSRRNVSGYLVVRAAGTGRTIDSRYSLTITRTRYRR